MDFLELQEGLNARTVELLGHGLPLSKVDEVTLLLLDDQELKRLLEAWTAYCNPT